MNPSATSPSVFQPTQLAAITLRAATQVLDMNLAATRLMLQTQARAAAAFGLPDWSDWITAANERSRRLFETGTDQWLSTTERASDTARELQREMGRLIEAQSARAAEQWEQGLQQLGTQTQQGLDQWREATLRNAEEVQRRGESAGRELQAHFLRTGEELREQAAAAGHELRRTVVQGAEIAQQSAAESTPDSAKH